MAIESSITLVPGRKYHPPALKTPKPRKRRASSTKYDQAAILRDAKARMAPRDYPGPQHVLDSKLGRFVPVFAYRDAFSSALKTCWLEAKQAQRIAEISAEASARISPENKTKIRELCAASEGLPITAAGNREYRRATAEIDALTWGTR